MEPSADQTVKLPSVDRLRAIAAQARGQGCAELAVEVERLATLAEELVAAPTRCARCGGALQAPRVRLRLLEEGGGARCLWTALCLGCADELQEWLAPAGAQIP